MGNMLSGIIFLAIGVIVLANVFISTVKATNTTGWTTGETSLFNSMGEVKSLKKTGTLKSQSDLKSKSNILDRGNAYLVNLEREYNLGKRQGYNNIIVNRYAEHTQKNTKCMKSLIKNFDDNKMLGSFDNCRYCWSSARSIERFWSCIDFENSNTPTGVC